MVQSFLANMLGCFCWYPRVLKVSNMQWWWFDKHWGTAKAGILRRAVWVNGIENDVELFGIYPTESHRGSLPCWQYLLVPLMSCRYIFSFICWNWIYVRLVDCHFFSCSSCAILTSNLWTDTFVNWQFYFNNIIFRFSSITIIHTYIINNNGEEGHHRPSTNKWSIEDV